MTFDRNDKAVQRVLQTLPAVLQSGQFEIALGEVAADVDCAVVAQRTTRRDGRNINPEEPPLFMTKRDGRWLLILPADNFRQANQTLWTPEQRTRFASLQEWYFSISSPAAREHVMGKPLPPPGSAQ
jgi:hypothetical protein